VQSLLLLVPVVIVARRPPEGALIHPHAGGVPGFPLAPFQGAITFASCSGGLRSAPTTGYYLAALQADQFIQSTRKVFPIQKTITGDTFALRAGREVAVSSRCQASCIVPISGVEEIER
jgi:hypothetical protein